MTFNICDHNEFHGIDIGYGSKNVNVLNNTVLQTYSLAGIVLGGHATDNITIKNNIIAFSSEEGIEIQAIFLNFIHDYNCFYQNGTAGWILFSGLGWLR